MIIWKHETIPNVQSSLHHTFLFFILHLELHVCDLFIAGVSRLILVNIIRNVCEGERSKNYISIHSSKIDQKFINFFFFIEPHTQKNR
jgi:hypothetical protein